MIGTNYNVEDGYKYKPAKKFFDQKKCQDLLLAFSFGYGINQVPFPVVKVQV